MTKQWRPLTDALSFTFHISLSLSSRQTEGLWQLNKKNMIAKLIYHSFRTITLKMIKPINKFKKKNTHIKKKKMKKHIERKKLICFKKELQQEKCRLWMLWETSITLLTMQSLDWTTIMPEKNMNNYKLDKISNSNIVSPYLDHKHTG